MIAYLRYIVTKEMPQKVTVNTQPYAKSVGCDVRILELEAQTNHLLTSNTEVN